MTCTTSKVNCPFSICGHSILGSLKPCLVESTSCLSIFLLAVSFWSLVIQHNCKIRIVRCDLQWGSTSFQCSLQGALLLRYFTFFEKYVHTSYVSLALAIGTSVRPFACHTRLYPSPPDLTPTSASHHTWSLQCSEFVMFMLKQYSWSFSFLYDRK